MSDTHSQERRLSEQDFAAITDMVRDIAGITLSANKHELVFGRLTKRLRALGLQTFAQYRALVASPDGEAERGEMINALTTNLTSFFREPHHFRTLADDAFPELFKKPDKRLRIWSAACSSGEEPYTIAMVLHKALANKGQWDARILATDIDTNMVQTAQDGVYELGRVSSVPSEFGRLYSKPQDGKVTMSDTLKQYIAFKPLNLLDEWPMRGKFDVIFCRNVVIYFDKAVQRTLFERFANIMSPRGWLFIGHSESLFRVSDRFENLGHTVYRKIG